MGTAATWGRRSPPNRHSRRPWQRRTRALRAVSPDLDITIEVGPSAPLVRGLEEGRFDFVLARLPQDYDARVFDVQPARIERVSLLVHEAHPMMARADLTLRDLADQDWVIQERGSPIRAALETAFLEAGVPVPARVTNSSSLLVMLALLEGADIIAPVSDEVAALLTRPGIGARLGRLAIRNPITVSPCFIIQSRDRPTSRAVDRVLTEVLTRL